MCSPSNLELKLVVPDALDLPLEALLPRVELDDLDVVEDLVHRLDSLPLPLHLAGNVEPAQPTHPHVERDQEHLGEKENIVTL